MSISTQSEIPRLEVPLTQAFLRGAGGDPAWVDLAHEVLLVAFIERNLTEIKLREEAMRVFNLLPARPVQGVITTIRAVEQSKIELKRILNPIQSNLRRSIDLAKEKICFRDHENWVRSVAFSPGWQNHRQWQF